MRTKAHFGQRACRENVRPVKPKLHETKMYAITGITGQVGGAMARALLSADKTVRAVVRKLRALQYPVAFLRPAWFMENFAWDVARARDSGIIASFLQPLDHDRKADIGRLAAQLIGEGMIMISNDESWDGSAGHYAPPSRREIIAGAASASMVISMSSGTTAQ